MAITRPFERAWQFRELIKAILSRELAVRFRGSILGWAWAIVAPLVMMLIYTVVFSGVLVVAGAHNRGGFGARALLIFSGITVFNLVTELLYRAPGLLHEHAAFIKKSIFPTETLAWIAVLRALVYAGISFGILVVFELALTRRLPATALMTPFVVAPLVMLLLGSTWLLMALGAFTRDITHLMATIVPVFMWITPVFYKMSDVPAPARAWMRLNPMADYIDMFRDVALNGVPPDPMTYVACCALSFVVFIVGYNFYIRYTSIIADVI